VLGDQVKEWRSALRGCTEFEKAISILSEAVEGGRKGNSTISRTCGAVNPVHPPFEEWSWGKDDNHHLMKSIKCFHWLKRYLRYPNEVKYWEQKKVHRSGIFHSQKILIIIPYWSMS